LERREWRGGEKNKVTGMNDSKIWTEAPQCSFCLPTQSPSLLLDRVKKRIDEKENHRRWVSLLGKLGGAWLSFLAIFLLIEMERSRSIEKCQASEA
jgi:hypothetical protein